MIFKPSSLHKLFFTYICPRFYGGAPSTPSNTTSTSTVNQSPWQNPVYEALMLGTADKPGPVTSMLNNSRNQMAQWNAINTVGLDPVKQASLGTWNPASSAATSTILDNVDPNTGRYVPTVNPNIAVKNSDGVYVSPASIAAPAATVPGAAQGGLMGLKGYATGSVVSPTYTSTSTPAEKAVDLQKAIASGYTPTADESTFLQSVGGNSPYNLTDTLKRTAYFDPITGQSTLGSFLQLQDEAKNLKAPEILDLAGQGAIGAYGATYALSDYAPTQTTATGYTAADMAQPTNIGATKTDAKQMQGAGNVSADKLNQYNMQGPKDVKAPTARNTQMAGPQSWLNPGTAQAYMNPYVQNVVNQEKEQSNRDYQQQLNQLNAQSVHAGAFGGSRQAIQQSEAARNQAFNLANIEAKGLEGAYTQGAQQFNTAQGQELQAGQANLGASQQTTLANQAAQIQAMMANQGMDYNTAVQNLQAQLGIQNTQAGQDLQAALANQQTQQQTQATNTAASNQAQQAYAQQQLQAAQANQGAQLATAQQNQAAQNAAAQQLAAQQLAAQQANQSAGLQANQQNTTAAGQLGSIANIGANIGSAQNAATLANMGAQGQVAQAQQNLGQSYLDAQSANATSWLNAPNAINAQAANVINAQPVSGGTTSTTGTAAPAKWARGGLIRKGSK